MERIASLSPAERKELFQETASSLGMNEAVIEKDFWVCWVLNRLFLDTELAEVLMFKGGTSLSKIHGLIERFSEDIDLILRWDQVSDEEQEAERGKKKTKKLKSKVRKDGATHIQEVLVPKINALLEDVCEVAPWEDQGDKTPYRIDVKYPADFSNESIKPKILLEIGPLALWAPNDTFTIVPYAAEVFPGQFEQSEITLNAVTAERTFWEKVTILHSESFRPDTGEFPKDHSRHYYDVAQMAGSSVKEKAFDNLDLLASVNTHKEKYWSYNWDRYDLAVPGTFRLIPPDHSLDSLKQDYAKMRDMFFGKYPSFEEVLGRLGELETEINSLKLPEKVGG